ncbi:GNAT family N-acetyltransferase [Chondromyces apiculatus]|uniref:N-acetyltransferase domain-containing protein n=1 Tax=Chondromyces apiculatus DSM 436 TaxID=1192034 RepID=A0A017TE60_9BACT|nr:GNAT family N-acetyltransferase [Chondromyces apiculatus]EYF07095.1 Hypothetical protein CAP_1026 [Chondromyces apiculatus DSM 436]
MPYPDDPALHAAAKALLGSAWPRVPPGIDLARAWGGDWFEISTPFFRFEGGTPVGHVGVIEIPLSFDGHDLTVAGIHGVCVHPAHRGRGHLREAMREALTWVDARHDTAILWTGEPDIYTRYGFQRCEEHIFKGPCPEGRSGQSRALALHDPEDLHLLRDLLARREAVSARSATRDPGWLFLIDLALWPGAVERGVLRYFPDLECVVVCDLKEGALQIHDVIAPRIPPLAALLPGLPGPADRIEVLITPDRLDAPALVPAPQPSIDLLMVRGRPLPVRSPFTLSPLTRC